jgi:hypothetical protein
MPCIGLDEDRRGCWTHREKLSWRGEVRYFAQHLPPVLTDRQRLAA